MVLAAVISFNFVGNAIGMVMAKIERKFKHRKVQRILKICPETIMPQSAIDTEYVAKGMS